MKKRVLLLLLGGILCLGLMVGCNPAEPPEDSDPSPDPTDTPTPTEEATPTPYYSAKYKVKKTISVTMNPHIADTKYASDVIVADVDATAEPFGADPTGETDSTIAIQNAIYAVYNKGGGTVYLPAGTYVVSSPIEVRAFVSLVGDCRDYNPDNLGEGGETRILACTASGEEEFPALFTLGGSAGIMNLRIEYPEQSADNIKPYAYAVSIPGHGDGGSTPENYMLSSVVNVSFVNAYRGIAASETGVYVNEQMNINCVYGTVLQTGMKLANSADASTIQNVDFSPELWVKAGADRARVTAFMKKNGTGMILGDVEWGSFSRISLKGYKTGIQTVAGKRAALSAIFYGVNVEAEDALIVNAVDERIGYGLGFTACKFSGNIINNTVGKVCLVQSTVDGTVKGNVTTEEYSGGEEPLSVEPQCPASPYSGTGSKPTLLITLSKLNCLAQKDVSADIQAALDEAGAAGGGIVYIPAGFYRLDSKLTVPDGVELRGSGTLQERDQMELSLGTLFFLCCGDNETDPENAQAAITLGENSGLRGVRMVYPHTDVLSSYIAGGETFADAHPYMVRGTGDGGYVYNCALISPIYGIQFRDCDGVFVGGISASAYRYTVRFENCKNAYVGNVLSNVTVGFRNRFWSLSNYAELFPNGWEASPESSATADNMNTFRIMMDNLTEVTFAHSDGIAEHIFSYSAQITLSAVDADVDALNLGRDCYYLYTVRETNPTLEVLEDSDVRVFNLTRFNGVSYRNDGTGTLEIYCRVTIYENEDSAILNPLVKTVYVGSPKDYTQSVVIADGMEKKGWKGNGAVSVTENGVKNESNSLLLLEQSISPLDLSEYANAENAYVYLEFYVDNLDTLGGIGFFEICSGGGCDKNEWTWGVGNNMIQAGENQLKLYLKNGENGSADGADINWSKVNYIRFYLMVNGKNGLTVRNLEIRY